MLDNCPREMKPHSRRGGGEKQRLRRLQIPQQDVDLHVLAKITAMIFAQSLHRDIFSEWRREATLKIPSRVNLGNKVAFNQAQPPLTGKNPKSIPPASQTSALRDETRPAARHTGHQSRFRDSTGPP